MKMDLKLTFSFLTGICGMTLALCNLIVIMFLPVATPSNIGEIISKKLRYTLGSPSHFLFLFVIPLALVGIFLGIKSLQKKIAIFIIALNLINLFLSLLIAWFLFGLARGM